MHKLKIAAVGLVALIGIGAAGIAYTAAAENRKEDKAEIATLSNAKIPLAQAIAIAEQQSGGKAIDAGLEDENGKLVFEVQVAKADSVHTVLVDAAAGTILDTRNADSERDEDHDENHQD